jgi:putative sugar O-methyltransferase
MKWTESTDRLIAELETCDPIYRPTNFWGPGVRQLSADLAAKGLDSFKSWPGASTWFYPVYGNGFSNATIAQTFDFAKSVNPRLREGWLAGALNGSWEARRDFDAARLTWDQSRWPFDLTGHGESKVGRPPQRFRLTGSDAVGWGKPYLNYLLCLAALSRHVDVPPRGFVEIGGGFGVLGEILLQRDPSARYVNLDIPPLLTVAAYYLTTVLGGRRVTTPDQAPAVGPITVGGAACLPNWRLTDVSGPFDVFVNTYSFQEMEPPVVDHYAEAIADKQVTYVLSLNSILGKPKAAAGKDGGVLDPVTSTTIIKLFEQRGYSLLATYRDPLIVSAGEIAIMQRR